MSKGAQLLRSVIYAAILRPAATSGALIVGLVGLGLRRGVMLSLRLRELLSLRLRVGLGLLLSRAGLVGRVLIEDLEQLARERRQELDAVGGHSLRSAVLLEDHVAVNELVSGS